MSYAKSEECTEITYYARKEWVSYFDFFDTNFDENQAMNINSKSVSFSQNIFGTHSEPKSVDSSIFNGTASYKKISDGTKKNPNYFSIAFGKPIRIGKVVFKIEASDNKTKRPVNKYIYANAYPEFVNNGVMVVQGNPIFTTSENDYVTLDFKMKEMSDLVILFEGNDNEYILSYFQVLEYQINETVEWTQDVIENAETKKVNACLGRGNFNRNGTGNWVKEANTTFTPSASLVSNYVPIQNSQSFYYDWGRGKNHSAYEEPFHIRDIGENAKQIQGWKITGDKPYLEYASLANKETAFEYIMTDKTKGIQYIAIPMYWASSIQADYAWSSSNDIGWCNNVLGMAIKPCYKHYGHSTNPRVNVMDVKVIEYNDVIPLELRVIDYVEYYLINDYNNEVKFIRKGKEEIQEFEFNKTGKWRIKVKLFDLFGNSGEVISNAFMIDQDKPNADYHIQYHSDSNVGVTIKPHDLHSGVLRWKYEISSDGGETYIQESDWLSSDEETIAFMQNGNYIIRTVVEDRVGNRNEIMSEVISITNNQANINHIIVPSYSIDKATPIHMIVECSGCKEKPKELFVFDDNLKVMSLTLNQDKNEIQTNFIPNKKKETKLRFQLDKQEIELTVFEKSYEYRESNDSLLEFEGVVASAIDQNKMEKFYKENLIVELEQDQHKVFTGKGIKINVRTQYQNECRVIEEFQCKSGLMQENGVLDPSLESGESFGIFNEGALPFIEKYKLNGTIRVPLTRNEMLLNLPWVFVDKRDGLVYEENTVERMDGKMKWYTNPRSELKTYEFSMNGLNYGHNQFSWKLIGNYELSHYYYDDFRIHFADPKDPFKNEMSTKWAGKTSWFKDLDLENPIQQFK